VIPVSYERFGKRLVDLVCSVCGYLCAAPLFIVIAVCIKLDSPGSVMFMQTRIGRHGELFRLMKFRSMYSDPTREKRGFTPGEKTRITRVGRILRATKLDELPQILNVVKGEMSIVGPRPEVPRYRNVYRGEYEAVLSMRPGITDWASIKYRNEEELLGASADPDETYEREILPDKLRLALEYKAHIGLGTDIGIICRTLTRVIQR
jgi:lipopolysaccharide/colanic/teichoic acid biosynthesis glycosyltransferase